MNDSKSLRCLSVASWLVTCMVGMEMLLPPVTRAQATVPLTNRSPLLNQSPLTARSPLIDRSPLPPNQSPLIDRSPLPPNQSPLINQSPLTNQSINRLQSTNRLKAGDRIRVTVTGFPEFSSEQIVLPDGTLQFPLAGSIPIAGQTPAEATTTITKALRPYIRRPQVGLAVLSIRPPKISVTGEVLRPGPRALVPPKPQQGSENSPDTGGETFQTVSYALVLAGGVTPNADIRNITIRRSGINMGSASQDEPAKSEIKVDLWRAIQTGDLTADLQLVDGDEIIVPTARISSSEQQQILTSTIAPNRINVQVAGSVNKPGPVQVAPSDGVSAAIAAAGGLTNDARQRITLLRLSPNGTLERRQLRFGENSEPLREGDVIVASRSTFSSVVNTLGTLLNPIAPLIYLFKK